MKICSYKMHYIDPFAYFGPLILEKKVAEMSMLEEITYILCALN